MKKVARGIERKDVRSCPRTQGIEAGLKLYKLCLKSHSINNHLSSKYSDPPSIGMGELKGRTVTVGAAVFVSVPRIHGASTPSTQYTPESTMVEAQQSAAVVPGILPQPLPPHTPHASGQHTVPIVFSTPLRPLGQLGGSISAS